MNLIQWQRINRWSNDNMSVSLGITTGYLSSIRHKKKIPSLLVAKAIVKFTEGLFTEGNVTLNDLGIKEKTAGSREI